MSNKLNAGPHALREALYELSMAQDVPDAKLLDEIVRRHPELGDVLTESAIALALDALRAAPAGGTASVSDPKAVSPAVSGALQRFQVRLGTLKGRPAARRGGRQETPGTAEASNPFQTLDRQGFRALAERLNANSVFVCKLRDRQIDPDTIPPAFQSRVARELNVPVELLQAHFAGRQMIPAGQRFKAEGRPTLSRQQSFEEAVRNSDLTPAQQRALLGT